MRIGQCVNLVSAVILTCPDGGAVHQSVCGAKTNACAEVAHNVFAVGCDAVAAAKVTRGVVEQGQFIACAVKPVARCCAVGAHKNARVADAVAVAAAGIVGGVSPCGARPAVKEIDGSVHRLGHVASVVGHGTENVARKVVIYLC